MTAPPLKARSSAGATPPRAASAVRTLARTETIMPMKPAAPESTAPITKPSAASQPSGAGSIAMTMARMTATIAIVVYWRFRNAIAPSWIAAAIDCIVALPAGCLSTQEARYTPYRIAMMPATRPTVIPSC